MIKEITIFPITTHIHHPLHDGFFDESSLQPTRPLHYVSCGKGVAFVSHAMKILFNGMVHPKRHVKLKRGGVRKFQPYMW